MTEETKRRKNPTLALILSAIFPGLGQVYNNQVLKGISLIALNAIINFLLIDPIERVLNTPAGSIPDNPTLFIVSAYALIGLVLLVYAIIDAKRTAERINREERQRVI
jgi:arabinogalactan oligomer/maltooligosaccharide transport system permease protein